MKKINFKIRSVVFLLILTGILMLLSGVINRIYVNDINMVSTRSKTYEALKKEKKDTIDLFVIGDSETYTTISPMSLWSLGGISSYVGGQHGQQLFEAEKMMKRAFERQKPKMVLLETNMFFRKNKTQLKMFDGLRKFKAKYFSVFQEHNVWKKLVRSGAGIAPVKDYKGFRIRTQVVSYNKKKNYMEKTTGVKKIKSSVKDAVKRMVAYCKEKDVKIVFYSAPAPKNYNYKKHRALKSFAKKLNVDYIDLNMDTAKIGIDWKMDSLDGGDHLNVLGAEKVTKYLSDIFINQYQLPDHRNDPKYAAWERLAENYRKELENCSLYRGI